MSATDSGGCTVVAANKEVDDGGGSEATAGNSKNIEIEKPALLTRISELKSQLSAAHLAFESLEETCLGYEESLKQIKSRARLTGQTDVCDVKAEGAAPIEIVSNDGDVERHVGAAIEPLKKSPQPQPPPPTPPPPRPPLQSSLPLSMEGVNTEKKLDKPHDPSVDISSELYHSGPGQPTEFMKADKLILQTVNDCLRMQLESRLEAELERAHAEELEKLVVADVAEKSIRTFDITMDNFSSTPAMPDVGVAMNEILKEKVSSLETDLARCRATFARDVEFLRRQLDSEREEHAKQLARLTNKLDRARIEKDAIQRRYAASLLSIN